MCSSDLRAAIEVLAAEVGAQDVEAGGSENQALAVALHRDGLAATSGIGDESGAQAAREAGEDERGQVVEVTGGEYYCLNCTNNGVNAAGAYGQINMRRQSEAELTFSFVVAGTNTLLIPAPRDVVWTFLDIDKQATTP